MSKKNAEQFIETVSRDKELQEKLTKRGQAYQGDSGDLEEVVRQGILPVAEELGLSFTAAEYLECVRELSKKAGAPESGSRKLSEDDLDLVVGGVSGDVEVKDVTVGGDLDIIDQSTSYHYYFSQTFNFPGADADKIKAFFG